MCPPKQDPKELNRPINTLVNLIPSIEDISGNIGRAETFPPQKYAKRIGPIASQHHLAYPIEGMDLIARRD